MRFVIFAADINACLHVDSVSQGHRLRLCDGGVFLAVVLHVQAEGLGKIAEVEQAAPATNIAVPQKFPFRGNGLGDGFPQGHGDIEPAAFRIICIARRTIDIVCKGKRITLPHEELSPLGCAFDAELSQCGDYIDAVSRRAMVGDG